MNMFGVSKYTVNIDKSVKGGLKPLNMLHITSIRSLGVKRGGFPFEHIISLNWLPYFYS
jgi:hypothetical protein